MDENRITRQNRRVPHSRIESGTHFQSGLSRRVFLCSAIGSAACLCRGRSIAAGAKPARRKVEIAWHGMPLRPRLKAFAAQQELFVFLDRRIDPDQELNFELSSALPPLRALDHVVDAIGAILLPVESVIAVVPTQYGDAIGAQWRMLQQRWRQVFGEAAKRRETIQWTDGESPRDIASRAEAAFGISLENSDAIPHDVWPGYTLPRLTAAAVFHVLLSGFDQTLQPLPPSRARVITSPAPESPERWFAAPENPPKLADLRKNFSELQWQRRGDWFVAVGNPERLSAAGDYLRQIDLETGAQVSSRARELYTLRVEQQPAGAILKTLEQRAGLKFQVDDDAAETLAERVTFEVVRVPLRTLLKRTLEPIGLQFRMDGDVVTVKRKSNSTAK